MADLTPKTISELPAVTTPTDLDLIPVSQSSASKKMTIAQIKALSINAATLSTDLNTHGDYSGQPEVVRYNTDTLHSPTSEGLTNYGYGICVTYASAATACSQFCFTSGYSFAFFRSQSSGTWTAWKQIPTYYDSETSITFGTGSYLRWAGDWRSTTSLFFTIPLSRPIRTNDSAISVTASGKIYVTCNGTREEIDLSNASSVTCYPIVTGVTVNVQFSSAPSSSSLYMPATVQPYGFTIAFS